ncbi:MAG: hypothetical protein QM770_07965 [Tepidisphaeraceae bacterium]
MKSPTTNLASAGHLATAIGATPAEFARAVERAGIMPDFEINGVPHYDAVSQKLIADMVQMAKSGATFTKRPTGERMTARPSGRRL